MAKLNSTLYCIHDPWFFGLKDGDMDDRAAFKYYEKYIMENPRKSVVVYVPGERYHLTIEYFKNSSIIFHNEFLRDVAESAKKICICAPVCDPGIRNILTDIITKKQNGYCQGHKIGSTNFPSMAYNELLESIPLYNRYNTITTNIQFHHTFLDVLDPVYKQDYLSYAILKLISPAGILHVPGLLYRLYCPIIGGGPGTNMLKIQEILQKYFGYLPDVMISEENFQEFNTRLIQEESLTTTEPIKKLMAGYPDNKVLEEALIVMVYFANLVFVKKDGSLLYEKNDICSLNTVPEGMLKIQLDETPPLYDLVAAFCTLNDIPCNHLTDHVSTRDMIVSRIN
jgi:hypothetical protein